MSYINYYKNQAQHGAGIPGFYGVSRYQRGHGLFGNFFRMIIPHIVPALKFIGKQAATTGMNIASDVILNKKDFKESAKEHLEHGAREIANTGLERAKKFVIEGKGRKRKLNTEVIKAKKPKLNKNILNYL